jgi:uncharacterized protein DUF3311
LPVAIAGLVTALVYALHQDFWFWRTARPLVFGFMPIGLFYHAAYTAAISLLMWALVRTHWPSHLEEADTSKPMGPGNVASERSDASHANGAGPGAPASERAGGSGGAKPPGQ